MDCTKLVVINIISKRQNLDSIRIYYVTYDFYVFMYLHENYYSLIYLMLNMFITNF